ncbi:hypothetical protein D3C81_1081800 [compost metagenome]
MHGDTGQLDCLDLGQRRDLAGSPNVPSDRFKDRRRLFGFKFKSDRPAREFIGITEHFTRTHIGDFDDGSVDQVIEGRPLFHDFIQGLDHFVKAVVIRYIRIHLETIVLKEGHHFPMILKFQVVRVSDIVEKSAKLPLRRRTWVQVAQGTGGSVAGILERLGRRLVVFGQYRQIHDTLALDFNCPIPVRNGQRHGFDRFHLR